MKKKNKGKKSLTAVGAVVAAGLTPGIVTGAPASQLPDPDVEFTAADAVVINGETVDFDELFAQVISDSREPQVVFKTVYGPRPPVAVEDDEQQAAIRAKMREDSIRRAMEARTLVYGPPPPKYRFVGPEELRSIAANDKQEAADVILEALLDYCRQMPLDTNATGNIILREDRDLVRELMMGSKQLEMLQQEISDRFEVQLSEEMLKQLSTLRRVADFIAEVVAPIKKE